MATSLLPDSELIKQAWACKCPKCGQGDLYKDRIQPTINEKCSSCGMALSEHDCGDGAAVFLIFVLGFLLVPAALLLQKLAEPPLWLHIIVWSIVTVGLTVLAMRPLKAYIIALQFKHRPGSWKDS